MSRKKAIVLLSGGLDSATVLCHVLDQGYETYGLIFDYGQRHKKEIKIAQHLAHVCGITAEVVKIGMPWKGSALLDKEILIPEHDAIDRHHIPATYVPARNIIFLSFAASYAEAVGAVRIFIGANAVDYSGYPDCRPAFFESYEAMMKQGLKTGVEGKKIKVGTPLLHKTKAQIIRMGMKLSVPYELTWSCYRGGKKPCGTCDSCQLRAKGFQQAGYADPLLAKRT